MRICIALFLLIVALPAFAKDTCYTEKQFRAEQALRYHTHLMVGGMLCQSYLQADTYTDYRQFTKRNQSVITSQENILIAYFKQQRKPQPEKALHGLRTDLANAISQKATESTLKFCETYKILWLEAQKMQPKGLKDKITNSAMTTNATTHSLCVAKKDKKNQ